MKRIEPFKCPDCGGDPRIAEIAKAFGHRVDIAAVMIRDLQSELTEARAENAELIELIANALMKMLPVYEGTDNMETAMLLDEMTLAIASSEAGGGE